MRGWGPRRAIRLAENNDDYYEHANSNILVLCQIETAEAVENVAEIAAVEGVDGLLIGPADLSISLGEPFAWAGGTFMDAVHRVRDAAEKANKPFGVVTSGAAFAHMWVREGARIIIAGSDAALLRMMAKQTFEEIRGLVGG
jgi:2-keto-3-deoxy-L-rhamnonate aldolase RhmA